MSVPLQEAGGQLVTSAARVLWSAPSGTALHSRLGGRIFGTIDGTRFLVLQPRSPSASRVTIVQNLPALLEGRPRER
jgi:hypothetical protein